VVWCSSFHRCQMGTIINPYFLKLLWGLDEIIHLEIMKICLILKYSKIILYHHDLFQVFLLQLFIHLCFQYFCFILLSSSWFPLSFSSFSPSLPLHVLPVLLFFLMLIFIDLFLSIQSPLTRSPTQLITMSTGKIRKSILIVAPHFWNQHGWQEPEPPLLIFQPHFLRMPFC
jgi:hypothetical protein